MLTVINSKIDNFIKPYKNEFGKQKTTKNELMEEMNTYLADNDFGGLDYFSKGELVVLDEITYQTAVCAIQKIARKTLASRTGVSESTVDRTVRKIKKTGLFMFGRLANGHAGVYAIVNKLHSLFKDVLVSVFGVQDVSEYELETHNDNSIDESFDNSSNSQTPSAPRDEEANSVSTYNTLNTFKTRLNKQQLQVAKIINKSETLKPHSYEIAYKLFQDELGELEWTALDIAVNRIIDNDYTPNKSAVAYFRKTFDDVHGAEQEARKEKIEMDFDVVEQTEQDRLGILAFDYINGETDNLTGEDRKEIYYNWLEE